MNEITNINIALKAILEKLNKVVTEIGSVDISTPERVQELSNEITELSNNINIT